MCSKLLHFWFNILAQFAAGQQWVGGMMVHQNLELLSVDVFGRSWFNQTGLPLSAMRDTADGEGGRLPASVLDIKPGENPDTAALRGDTRREKQVY